MDFCGAGKCLISKIKPLIKRIDTIDCSSGVRAEGQQKFGAARPVGEIANLLPNIIGI